MFEVRKQTTRAVVITIGLSMRSLGMISEWGLWVWFLSEVSGCDPWVRSLSEVYGLIPERGIWVWSLSEVYVWGLLVRSLCVIPLSEVHGCDPWVRSLSAVSGWGLWWGLWVRSLSEVSGWGYLCSMWVGGLYKFKQRNGTIIRKHGNIWFGYRGVSHEE